MKKNALYNGVSLAYLEIRSRNEEAINSTQNMIYSLKVFYFLLYRRNSRPRAQFPPILTDLGR